MRYEEFAHNQRAKISEEDLGLLRLWTHVLAHGLRDFAEDMRRITDQGAFPREPSYWFWSEADHPGSFVWCCDLLKRDPVRTRLAVLEQWRDLCLPDRRGA